MGLFLNALHHLLDSDLHDSIKIHYNLGLPAHAELFQRPFHSL